MLWPMARFARGFVPLKGFGGRCGALAHSIFPKDGPSLPTFPGSTRRVRVSSLQPFILIPMFNNIGANSRTISFKSALRIRNAWPSSSRRDRSSRKAGQNLPQLPVLAENVPGCFQPVQFCVHFVLGDRSCGSAQSSGLGWFSHGCSFPHRSS